MSDIFEAAGEGDLARVEELLAHGGDHMNVAKALIRAGAPLNVPGESLSPLYGAVTSSQYNMAAMLLSEGADVDAYSKDIGTPLSRAQDRRMATLLIAAGADVNAGSYSPLDWAAMHGRLDVLEELLAHPTINVNKRDERIQRTPLHYAAANHNTECVAALLAAGADACISNIDGQTPLLYCFANNQDYSDFRIIAMLVAAGDRQWAHVPSPCPGLESALLPVWSAAPQELGQLFSRLENPVKRRIQTALCVLHHVSPRHLPDHIRMRLLDESFNV